MSFHAFISYSHSDCGNIAPAIQKAIENIGKPWFRIGRNLTVFRDETNLAASPNLWNTIETALSNSKNFILLASSKATQSYWINKEVENWLQNHFSEKNGLNNFYIVKTNGDLLWNNNTNDWDWAKTNCLPSILKNKFSAEPLWIDLAEFVNQNDLPINYKSPSFTSNLVKIVAGILNKPPREVESKELNRKRKSTAALVISSMAFVLLVITGLFLFNQSKDNERQSISNNLIAEGNKYRESDISKALLFYFYAYKTNPRNELFSIINDFYVSQKLGNSSRLENYDIKSDEYSLFLKRLEFDKRINTNLVGISDNELFFIDSSYLYFYSLVDTKFKAKFKIPENFKLITYNESMAAFQNISEYLPWSYKNTSVIEIFDIKNKKFKKLEPQNILTNLYNTFQYGISGDQIIFFSKDFENDNHDFDFILTIVNMANFQSKQLHIINKQEKLARNFENINLSPNGDYLYFNTHLHNRYDYYQSFLLYLKGNYLAYKTNAINNDYDYDESVIATNFLSDSAFIESRRDGNFRVTDFTSEESKNFRSTVLFKDIVDYHSIDKLLFAVNSENHFRIYEFNLDSYSKNRLFLNEILFLKEVKLPFSTNSDDIPNPKLLVQNKSIYIVSEKGEICVLNLQKQLTLKADIKVLEIQIKDMLGDYDLSEDEKIKYGIGI
jgi:hypothetical protein